MACSNPFYIQLVETLNPRNSPALHTARRLVSRTVDPFLPLLWMLSSKLSRTGSALVRRDPRVNEGWLAQILVFQNTAQTILFVILCVGAHFCPFPFASLPLIFLGGGLWSGLISTHLDIVDTQENDTYTAPISLHLDPPFTRFCEKFEYDR